VRTIAHISDLHFGRLHEPAADALVEDLERQPVDLVAVSGDLTQRARRSEFRAARAFLDRIPAPVLVVPGNHDVPLYDVTRRLLRPLRRYKQLITDDLTPLHVDDEIVVLGLNTARTLTFKNGRLSLPQIALIRTRLGGLDEGLFKVVVTHHPFAPPAEHPASTLVGRIALALKAMEGAGVDLLLAGHTHVGSVGDLRRHHGKVLDGPILFAQAGTTLSRRHRGEPNSYNLVRVETDRVEITVRSLGDDGFGPHAVSVYERTADGWTPQDKDEPEGPLDAQHASA
jgi:3',5'-cyclic AMP phosphodiesterase CpdA